MANLYQVMLFPDRVSEAVTDSAVNCYHLGISWAQGHLHRQGTGRADAEATSKSIGKKAMGLETQSTKLDFTYGKKQTAQPAYNVLIEKGHINFWSPACRYSQSHNVGIQQPDIISEVLLQKKLSKQHKETRTAHLSVMNSDSAV